jgi:hypothetical protein
MSHYKRGKCRYQGKGRRSGETFRRGRLGLKPVRVPHWTERDPEIDYWPAGSGRCHWWAYPRWHDIIYHSRRRRAAEARLEHRILTGQDDPEGVCWPLSKKPHVYYW